MQHTNLELSPAAWFFVNDATSDGAGNQNVAIKTPFRIGRQPDLDLYLPCQNVSGLHAEIVEEDGVLWLTDLKSTNGTFVNGKRIRSKTRLSANDTIQFGTTVFQIFQKSSEGGEAVPEDVHHVGVRSTEKQSQDAKLENLLNGGVVPFFQPVVSLEESGQRVIGYEVLGRSRLFGLKTPAQMFAAASRLELEAELSRVLRKQGITVADKNLEAEQSLFVNTHPAELECAGLEESLFEIRELYPARPILLEVNESVLNEPEKFQRIRATLQNLEIKLVLHDVGGGNVHLANLAEVFPDVVKFDNKLIQGIDKMSQRKQKFVASLVKMIKELGAVPMAQFVEQEAEHETVSQMGFSLGQGFFYGRPSEISKWAPESIPKIESCLNEIENIEKPAAPDEQGEPKDAAWLLQQPKNHFTVQVLSAISEGRAIEHVFAQKDPGNFSIFGKQGKTRMLYIVCYGIYEDRAAAKEVAEQLADSSVSPWIRMLSSIHAEIDNKG